MTKPEFTDADNLGPVEVSDIFAAAGSDDGPPLRGSIETVVRRGRRRTHLRRATGITAGVAAVGVLAGAAVALPDFTGGSGQAGPVAGRPAAASSTSPSKHVTDRQPGPASLSAAEIVRRCAEFDRGSIGVTSNKAGGGTEPLNNWSVAVTQAKGSWFRAMLVSPDRKRFAYCKDTGTRYPGSRVNDYSLERQAVRIVKDFEVYTEVDGSQGRVPAGVTRISFERPDGSVSDAVIRRGYYLWYTEPMWSGEDRETANKPVWARFYDATGRLVKTFDANPPVPTPTIRIGSTVHLPR